MRYLAEPNLILESLIYLGLRASKLDPELLEKRLIKMGCTDLAPFHSHYAPFRQLLEQLDREAALPEEALAELFTDLAGFPRSTAGAYSLALLLFLPEGMLHVSRPVRWDSDHVTIMNDETQELMKEIVRCDALDRVHIGLDYFDASINRIGAYVVGSRATQKCLMQALLEPLAKLREYEANGQGFERLALLEESKSMPWNAVWDMFCLRNNVPVGEEFIAEIQKYEREVTSKRA